MLFTVLLLYINKFKKKKQIPAPLRAGTGFSCRLHGSFKKENENERVMIHHKLFLCEPLSKLYHRYV